MEFITNIFNNYLNFGFLGIMLLVLSIGIILIIYFLPTIIADHRKKKQFTAIRLINIFLGFTIIGWVGSLVWAVLKEDSDGSS